RYGVKPLYYYFRNGIFAFASEVKSLLQHPAISASLSAPALNEYFSFQNIFSDLTLFEGVRLLPPAHTLVLHARSGEAPVTCAYWDYEFAEGESATEEEYIEELHRL